MVSLSVAIMHLPQEPRRRVMLNDLLRALQPEARELGVPITVVRALERNGPWPTARRAWSANPLGTTHRLVIQEDVVPCRRALWACLRALEANPEEPVAFYANRDACSRAAARGDAWVKLDCGVWGQAFCLPSTMIRGFLEWEKKNISPDCPHDDSRLAAYLHAINRPAWATVPSLFDHGAPEDSTLGYSNAKKVARIFQRDWPVEGIEFTNGLLGPIHHREGIPLTVKRYLKGANS